MSLITTASVWTNEENGSKKRVSTMRRTVRKTQTNEPSSTLNTPIVIEKEDERPSSFDEDSKQNEQRADRVAQLINNITEVSGNNDENQLVDFTPIPPPDVQKRQDSENGTYGRTGEEDLPVLSNQLQHLPKRIQPGESDYAPTLPDLGVSNNPSQTKPFSNYHRIYEQPRMQPAYYGNVDTSAGTTVIDNRLLEKINYMIHMLEQEQSEKTSNITEEFILYTFLGVFIIFVIDSFARSGKYTR